MAKRKPAKPVSKDNAPKTPLDAMIEAGSKLDSATTEPVSSSPKEDNNNNQDQNEAKDVHQSPQSADQDDEKNRGNVAIEPASELDAVGSSLTREESQAAATRRWRNEGIAEQVAVFRDRVREEYRAANPGCKRRDAHEHAWDRAMAEFPPAGAPKPAAAEPPKPVPDPVSAPIQADGGVSGLSNFPSDWPRLPANAQLQAEIAWVTANRLLVRDGSGVNLSRAMSPPPSYAALSWLETSILFPAKFADISVKATAETDDEKEFIRREKLAIEEIRSILKEMMDAKD